VFFTTGAPFLFLVAIDFGLSFVMPGLVPGIHVFPCRQDVDGRVKPGHDDIYVHPDGNDGC
jgi:hypothetical protein